MNWQDKSIILKIKKYGETSAIVTLLAENHGLYSGIVKSIFSSKSNAIYQIGNIVEANWKARLSEHLGVLSCEILDSIASFAMFNEKMLLAVNSSSNLILLSLAERVKENTIFNNFIKLLYAIKTNDDLWINYYLSFEINLLSELGFALDLSECVVTQSKENLTYISPKSGKAVSLTSGEPYKNKLLPFPKVLINPHNFTNYDDLLLALEITGFFLNKALNSINNSSLPPIRSSLMKKLINSNLI